MGVRFLSLFHLFQSESCVLRKTSLHFLLLLFSGLSYWIESHLICSEWCLCARLYMLSPKSIRLLLWPGFSIDKKMAVGRSQVCGNSDCVHHSNWLDSHFTRHLGGRMHGARERRASTQPQSLLCITNQCCSWFGF